MRATVRQAAIGLGFGPWVLYGLLAAGGHPRLGALAALVGAAALCARGAARGTPKILEGTALGFFALATAVAALGVDGERDAAILAATATLAVVAALGIIVGRPFTADYARETWPPEYWEAPLFVRINLLLSGVWTAVFALTALAAAGAMLRPAARGWLAALSAVASAAGIVVSVLVPRWYPRRWAARAIAARVPYRWPAPRFDGRSAHDVIVIGSGIGGLTAAGLLAARGLRVLVLEQHDLAGGFCTSWPRLVRRGDDRLRYVFDAGVHDVSGLGADGAVRHLLGRLGIAERLDWRRMTHEYIVDGVHVKVPERVDDFTAELARRFPAESEHVRRFFAEMAAIYRDLYADARSTEGVPRPPATVEALLAWPASHPHAFRGMHMSFDAMLRRHIADPRLVRLLLVLTGYLTDEPAKLTATAMAPIFGFYLDGGYYPRGGSQALADALVEAVAASHGEVRLRTPASRVIVEDGRAVGVELATGERLLASAIVSDADVRRTFLDLVGARYLPRDFVERVRALRPSASAFVTFLGVDYVPDVAPITMYADSAASLGIAIPSKVDPSLAPAGHSAITLTTLVPAAEAAGWDRRAVGYGARRRAEGDRLVALAHDAMPGLRDHIVYRQDGTPATFARYAWTTGGAIYGAALGQWQPPAVSPIEGLVLAGAGVFPGAGVEAVVISGTIAADALCPVPVGAREQPILVA